MIKLSNGLEVPVIGLGTSHRNKKFTADEFVESVKHALQVGYRHLDTAKLYNNEHLIAKAIKVSLSRTRTEHLNLPYAVKVDQLVRSRSTSSWD